MIETLIVILLVLDSALLILLAHLNMITNDLIYRNLLKYEEEDDENRSN